MKREQLSKIITNIDERLIAEAYQFAPEHCSDSPGRIVHMKKIISFVIAAALLFALGITAYAIYNWRLQDLVIHSSNADDTELNESQSYFPLPKDVDVISLQGYTDSPEYQAMLAWSEFRKEYDPDGELLAQAGNGETPWDHTYNANGYGIYSQEMADALDAIAEEYGLSLHSGVQHTASIHEMYEHFGRFCQVENAYGYYYDDGSFQCDCIYNGLEFQMRRTRKGILDGVGLNINDVDQYEQWEYQTANGTTILLAIGPNKALIIADLPDSFVTVNILNNLQPRSGESIFSKQDIEALADSFDFSIL